jgi:hypothetical protein
MCELSSGHPPFYDNIDLKMLIYNLIKGTRKIPFLIHLMNT